MPALIEADHVSISSRKAFTPPRPNPALFTNQHHEIYMGESPAVVPKSDECVVHMRANGICGSVSSTTLKHYLEADNLLSSDVHFWKTGRIASLEVRDNHVLGHEGAGEIVWVGEQVKHLKIGDRVAVEPGVPCELCYECTTGTYNLCDDVKFSGVPPYPGSIRRYHAHPARYLHKIPDTLSFADGALLEPLSVVLHGFERSPLRLGESTVICGAGPIGMTALACAKASGAAVIVVTDIDQGRLDLAKKFVPTVITVRIESERSAHEMAALIKQEIQNAGGGRPRVVYECTGVQSSVVTAAYLPRPTGEVMVIGVGKPIMNELPFMHMSLAEVDLKYINRYHHSWPVAISMLANKVIDLKPLITHTFKLEQAVEALTAAADRSSGSVKIHIVDDDEASATNGHTSYGLSGVH